jgi:hypothetical protein
MFESMTVIMTYLVIIMSPVLIPAFIHAVHGVRDRRQPSEPGLAARYRRPTVTRRLAVPAMA